MLCPDLETRVEARVEMRINTGVETRVFPRYHTTEKQQEAHVQNAKHPKSGGYSEPLSSLHLRPFIWVGSPPGCALPLSSPPLVNMEARHRSPASYRSCCSPDRVNVFSCGTADRPHMLNTREYRL